MTDLSETDLKARLRRLERRTLPGGDTTPVKLTGTGGSDVAVEDDDSLVSDSVQTINFQSSLGVQYDGSGQVTVDAASGSGGYATITTTATDMNLSDAEFALGDASGGVVNITLPQPVEGLLVGVKKIDSSGNNVNITTPDTQTIDGTANLSLSSQYTSREITSDGQDYYII